ncbi:MAG: OprD family outer membrane porin [Campylobacterota bacterium]|nr:OprD family outer membrane porin [Campylobacterota bacterium]
MTANIQQTQRSKAINSLKEYIKPLGAITLLTSTLFATPKVVIKPNMQLQYKTTPNNIESISDLISQGIWYGRVRSNTFFYDYKSQDRDHYVTGLGGSIIYKSAYYHDFGMTLGLYSTVNPIHMDDADATKYKPGKGVLSRYDVLSNSDYSMTSLTQAYLEYKNFKTSIKIGRQLFESMLTKSNDTKMIPNAFEGVSLESHYLNHTTIKLGYFTRMKLRDHSTFHHILAYGDNANDPYAKYTQNDDSGVHKGLTLSKLQTNGIDDHLIIAQIKNSSSDNLLLNLNYTSVPDLIAHASIEAKYTFNINGLKISPAFRYIHQFDEGAGVIGGANLKNSTLGYSNPTSMDSWLLAGRVDIVDNAWKLRFGYSKVADKADLLTPWRGFPTGGYTRTMSQYNWYANTTTYMIRADYNLGKAGLMENTYALIRYAIHDFDDEKVGVQADNHTLTLDIMKQFMPNLYFKTRVGINRGEDDIVAMDSSIKSDPSYNEIRFELNYLF